MAKKLPENYRRISGCLARADADRLYDDLWEIRRRTGRPTLYIRQRYGDGWAVYEVTPPSDRLRTAS